MCCLFWLFKHCDLTSCPTISRHSVSVQTFKSSPPLWKCNFLLLADIVFCDFVSNFIDDFLRFNYNESTSYSPLWELLKAFLRGQVISFSSFRNKKKNARIAHLVSDIVDLDQECALNLSPALFNKCLNLQAQFDIISPCCCKHMEIIMNMVKRQIDYCTSVETSLLLTRSLKLITVLAYISPIL